MRDEIQALFVIGFHPLSLLFAVIAMPGSDFCRGQDVSWGREVNWPGIQVGESLRRAKVSPDCSNPLKWLKLN
jgi:hypothetical protein